MDSLIVFGAKYLIVVVCLIFVWVFFKQKKQQQKEMLIFSIVILPVTYLVAKILGHFYYDPRPFVEENIIPLISHVADNGFPSDHTLFSSALAAVACFFDKKIGILLFVLGLLVGFSRVFAGVHHTIDIIGAFIIAIIVAWIVGKLLKMFAFVK